MKNRLTDVTKKYQPFIYTTPFMLTVLMLNLHFMLGSLYNPNIIYTALNVLTAFICFIWAAYSVLRLWIDVGSYRRQLIRIIPVILFFTICYLIAFARYGLYSGLFRQAKAFILYAPTAILVGGLLGVGRKETDFFDNAEWFAVFSFPVALNYVTMLFTDTSPYTNGGIGIADYMHLSYAYMPLLFVLAIQIVRGKTTFLWIEGQKKAFIVRTVLIILIWMLILGCATRGTIFCILIFFVLLVFYMLYSAHFNKINFRRLVLVFGIIIVQFAAFTYVFTPKGLARLERVNHFTESLKSGEVETAKDSPSVNEFGLDNLVNSLSPTYAVDLENSGIDYKTKDDAWIIGHTIKDRVTIYTLAWKEALKHPFTGMGPFGFIAKYGNYPHNFALELFTDLGFIMGSAVLIFIVLCFIKLVGYCKRDSDMGYMLVLLCGYVGYLMISGTVWNQPILSLGIAYSLCYTPSKRTTPANE